MGSASGFGEAISVGIVRKLQTSNFRETSSLKLQRRHGGRLELLKFGASQEFGV
jgi:hypothetical protein